MKKFFLAPAVAALLFCVSCSSPASKVADAYNEAAEKIENAKTPEDKLKVADELTKAIEEATKDLNDSEKAELQKDADVKAAQEKYNKALGM